LDLRLLAFPVRAVISPGEQQSIFVIVQDQTRAPLPDADVSVIVHLPSGDKPFLLAPTNGFGIASGTLPFEVTPNDAGWVEVVVEVRYQAQFTKRVVTSFRITP